MAPLAERRRNVPHRSQWRSEFLENGNQGLGRGFAMPEKAVPVVREHPIATGELPQGLEFGFDHSSLSRIWAVRLLVDLYVDNFCRPVVSRKFIEGRNVD
jgi:hypothetical protein